MDGLKSPKQAERRRNTRQEKPFQHKVGGGRRDKAKTKKIKEL